MLEDVTVICHFYNEEYLLPAWLKHHREKFSFGIMIDYHSTDNSRVIINNLCPTWMLVTSENKHFEAELVDREVEKYEKLINGWVIALNVTEFMLGDLSIVNTTKKSRLYIPQIMLVESKIDDSDYSAFDFEKAIFHKNTINYWDHPLLRQSRLLHKDRRKYPTGRHFPFINQKSLIIVHVANYLISNHMVARALQIQHKIPHSDKVRWIGSQHFWDIDIGLNLDRLVQRVHNYDDYTNSPSKIMINYYKLYNKEKLRTVYYFKFSYLFILTKLRINFLNTRRYLFSSMRFILKNTIFYL